jgi:tetratricopeptide (TPR) repeat protein
MRIGIYLLLSFLSIALSAQDDPSLDSLRAAFDDSQASDSLRYDAGFALFMRYFRSDINKAEDMGHELQAFSQEIERLDLESKSIRLIGNTYAVRSSYDTALIYFLESREVAEQAGDSASLAALYSNIGAVFYEQGNYIAAIQNLIDGLRLSEQISDSVGIARVSNNLGNVFQKQRDYEEALGYYEYSLRIKENFGNPYSIAKTYNNIGLVLTNLGRGEESIEALEKCISICEEIKDYKTLANAYNNLGHELNRQGRFDEALGDGIMALFPEKPEDDMHASIAMQTSIRNYNKERKERGRIPLEVGIGFHSGPLIMGIIGDESRNDTAIIADTVNTASRMEGITKHFGARIIVSGDSVRAFASDHPFHLRYLGKVILVGKEKAMEVYECFDSDEARSIELKLKSQDKFKEAIEDFYGISLADHFAKATI